MVLLGKIDSFNHKSDDIFIERVDQYFLLTVSMMKRRRV